MPAPFVGPPRRTAGETPGVDKRIDGPGEQPRDDPVLGQALEPPTGLNGPHSQASGNLILCHLVRPTPFPSSKRTGHHPVRCGAPIIFVSARPTSYLWWPWQPHLGGPLLCAMGPAALRSSFATPLAASALVFGFGSRGGVRGNFCFLSASPCCHYGSDYIPAAHSVR